jgi:uncharacterized membrane protein
MFLGVRDISSTQSLNIALIALGITALACGFMLIFIGYSRVKAILNQNKTAQADLSDAIRGVPVPFDRIRLGKIMI